jgi:hypothetical protein
MEKNRKIIAIAIIALAAIALIFFLITLLHKGKDENVENPVGTSSTGELVDENLPTPGDRPIDPSRYDISKETPHKTDVEDISKLASFFAERLGSFSNQSDYGNISDLKMFMTDSMRTWADGYIAKLKEENSSAEYYGISTTAVVPTVNSFDESAGEAEVTIATKRKEIKGITESSFDQDLKVSLVKDGDDWKVDGAYWEK